MNDVAAPPVFRFAPSPNGRLHLGHAYSALLNAQMAADVEGRFLLRIEDIDVTRSRSAFEAAIPEDLAWLGLTFPEAPRRQSEHGDDYARALAALEARGLVERHPDPDDGRRVVLSITEAGQGLLRDKRNARTEQLAKALAAGFTPAEIEQLMTAVPLLERLAQSI